MKKVLVLSALGCLATIGAVFAAFTLDPTNVSDEITNTDIDVDLSSKVFSTFLPTNEFTYIDPTTGKDLYNDVPVSNPKFIFKGDDKYDEGGAIVGSTLGLHVKEPYTYDSFLEYLEWRKKNPKPEKEEDIPAWEAENKKYAPKGYAFRYEYDENFIKRIEQDDVIPPVMQQKGNEWLYPIYKTNFSSGLTKSKFTKAGLAPFHIGYEDPDATNPNYKYFTWDKSKIEDTTSEWYLGGDGFFIQPDVVDDPSAGLKHLNKGTIIFTGVEMTDDLFTGQFTSADDVKGCADYLNEQDENGAYIHKEFSLKIKVTEYFKVTSHELTEEGDRFIYINGKDSAPTQLLTQDRYSFSFTATKNTEQLFEDGYQIDKFALIDEDGNTPLSLLDKADGSPSALGLKVTKTSQNGNATETDVTSSFSYGNNPGDPEHLGTIYYNGNASLTLVEGDVITFNFTFRKDSGTFEDKVNWFGAGATLTIPVKGKYELKFTEADNQYVYDAEANPITLAKNELHRFEIPFDNINKRYNDTFALKDADNNIVPLDADITSIYIRNSNLGTETILSDNDYTINGNGTITFDPFIVERFGIDNDAYKLHVDIMNKKDSALVVKTATLTCHNVEQDQAFPTTYTITDPTDDLSGGYFDGTAVPTMTPGKMYNFTVDMKASQNFYSSLEKISEASGSVTNITLSFTLYDSSEAPINLSTDENLDIYVSRTTGNPQKTYNDTLSYSYDNATSSIVNSQDNVDYWKTVYNDVSSGYITLSIKFIYKGATEITNAKSSKLSLSVAHK